MATTGVSSSERHKLSTSITTALASALLEWLLIFFLFIDAIFSYAITKFAGYCKLQTPCLFCSRLDHVLGKDKKGYYWDFICSGHKSAISSLVLCRAHDKLVNVQGMCESCLFSFATINKSNAETYRLLMGKLGKESDSRFDQDPLLGEHTIATRCSCCDEQWVLKGYDQRLVFTNSIGPGDADFDVSDTDANNFHVKKRRAKPSVSVRAAHLRNTQLDPLSHVGYTELKITSDTESESEVPLSDNDGTSIPVRGTDHTNEDIKVTHEHVEPCIIDLNENLASGKPRSSASPLEPSLSESGMQLENADIHGNKSAAATTESGNGLEELYWQQFEGNAVCPSPSEPISFNDVPTLTNKMGVPVEVSNENYDLATDEVGLTSEKRSTMDCEEIIKSGDKLTTSEASLEPNPPSSDIGQQNPSLLDLGDAYKLAVSNRGRQLSGMLAENWLGKDSTRISEDLKMLLSQFSSRGTDLSVNDVSPRLSINGDEVKTSDVSNSAGMQILQKMISLERNESGLSLDGSIVSEIEGESLVDRLKRQVDHDRKLMSALYKELEEERNASAVAANQALAMITRLQEEKATLHMEALQYLRMMDEQSEYDTEAMQKAVDLLAEKEKDIEYLEAKLEFYRKKFPDESVLENMVETYSEMRVKDIGLDHSQCTFIENDESVLGKSVTENPNISDKAGGLLTSLEEKNVQSVRSSPLEFQDERLYISQRLKKLEKQVYFFLNIHQPQDSCLSSENAEQESPENSEKLDNNLLMQDSVSSHKLNSDAMGEVPSSKKPPVCKENGELGYDGHSSPVLFGNNDLASAGSLVSSFIGRLQDLEADLSFLQHTINLLSNGDEGLKLLHEIADHLQQLRRIGIREIDQPVA